MISQATHRIMACLRDTLNRLRHPPAEELGLEACLVDLVDSWRSRNATQPMIQLDFKGDLADVRGAVAATAYRVAQECLTNSLRHSSAREIVLRIERRTGAENALLIHVEDDGGGDAAKVAASTGFGLTGIRERVTALGGSTESFSPSVSVLDQLGEREIEILRQLAAGATTEQIASNLNLSMKTVQNYHYLIKTKTGMRTDAQLVRLAVECGLASL